MTDRELENFYREHLEEDIVMCLSDRMNISLDEAMRLFYHSKLAEKINKGEYGIQYLDHSILTEYLEQEISSNMT